MNNFAIAELVKRLNVVYYLIYTLTIVVTAFGFFLDFHNFISVGAADVKVIALIYMVLAIAIAVFALLWFELVRRKTRTVRNEKQGLKIYGNAASIRLYLIGLALVGGVVVFYLTKELNALYCVAAMAIALIYSKPSETKVGNDLQTDED